MKDKISIITISLTLLITVKASTAAPLILYDGTSGVTPDQYNSPSLNFGTANISNPTILGTQTVNTSNSSTTLNSSVSNSIYAGYSNYNIANPPTNPSSIITPTTFVNSSFPTLDRNTGYQLTFTVKINSQINDGTNGDYRSGFSVIALSSDKKGIEIGLRTNDIFSQASASFDSIGEQATSSTVPNISTLLSNLTNYNLSILGDNYTLTSGATTLLSGSLKDYSSATGFGSDVYKSPNFIFLGDNTTSARASVDISYVAITTNTAPVPYAFSPAMGIWGLVGVGTVYQWLKKKKS